MSTKDDSLKDKKTKKKKNTKSAEEKAKENADEQTAEQGNIKEEMTNVESSVPELAEELVNDKVSTDTTPQSTPGETIIESTSEDNRPNRKESRKSGKEQIKPADFEKLSELKEAFSLFDFNHDGIIDLQDLKYTFVSLGKPDFPEEDMQKMLKEANEHLDFDAFVALFGYKVSTLDPEDVFTKALARWDMRDVGMIPEESLKRDIRCFGDKFTGKETDSALEEAPIYVTEGIPMIDYIKFSSNICGFRNVEKTRKYQKELENAQGHK